MSDFYQILQREIEQKPVNKKLGEIIEKNDTGSGLAVEKSPIENNDLLGSPKTEKRAKKTKPTKTKKTRSKRSKPDLSSASYAGEKSVLSVEPANPIWLTMAEAAKLAGVQKRTIKRAIRSGALKYRIVDNRYRVDLRVVLLYVFSKKKLKNKFHEFGLGQYVEKFIK